MDQIAYRWYILFPNHHQGLQLSRELRKANIRNQISPTPREASSCCGISLIVERDDLDRIGKIIEEYGISIDKIVKLPVKTDWQYRGI